MTDPYKVLCDRLREIHRLHGAMALLGWDQEVIMPPAAARTRAAQRATLAGIIHERLVAPELGAALADLQCVDDLDPVAAANLRETRRVRDRAVALPSSLVRDIAETAALSQPEWVRARADDDWSRFAPHLTRLVELKRREAAILAIGDEPYDALLDEYEPGARTADLLPVFTDLRASLTDLLERLDTAAGPAMSLGRGPFPAGRQDAVCRRVLDAMGYDFAAGRLDVSAHPFTESLGRGDIRITNRYDESDPLPGITAALHEGGHALYEQGLPADFAETTAGQAVSLGIHESQSRLWENHVGRSMPFCRYLAPILAEAFPDQVPDLPPEHLYRALNVVQHSPIRIDADEVTYNLHIILRLEIERALIAGDLAPADVPAAWRAKAREYLHLDLADDRTGALQDIHWSLGSFGYFPTYTLGNLYAAMFWNAARLALPDLDAHLAVGDCAGLRGWLREHIHARGSVLTASESMATS